MRLNMRLAPVFIFALPIFVTEHVFAANACVQACQAESRRAVEFCNYPKREPQALKECLATVRWNFDSCMHACGK